MAFLLLQSEPARARFGCLFDSNTGGSFLRAGTPDGDTIILSQLAMGPLRAALERVLDWGLFASPLSQTLWTRRIAFQQVIDIGSAPNFNPVNVDPLYPTAAVAPAIDIVDANTLFFKNLGVGNDRMVAFVDMSFRHSLR
jgi:hypothetical protein